MNGIKDFNAPEYVDIVHPERGFFGYLLRCKCLRDEELFGNFIFLDDGAECCVRFPVVKKRREEIRREWNSRANRYGDIFQGQIYYIKDELFNYFIDFMSCSPHDVVRQFLEKFMAEVRASVIYNSLGLEPLYAVSHVCQLTRDDRIYCPHIHVLWGIKKN